MQKITLVYTCYKVGSCTLYEYLTRNNITTCRWITSGEKIDESKEHLVIKAHTVRGPIDEQLMCNGIEGVKVIFTILRDPTEVYYSAFFQDISTFGYPYYFGTKEEVLKAEIGELVEFFGRFDWEGFEHLDQELGVKNLMEYIGEGEGIKEDGYEIIYGENGIIGCVLQCRILRDKWMMKGIMRLLGYEDEIVNSIDGIEDCNVSEDKWYGEKYKEFKKAMGRGSE